ncbi:MAG: Fe-S protein assembly co-chaperone HscB [Gammaproteobacteria bacterium]|nr:Fe-S protein assembly co-chaperone HscB [Gammaproteobacteria bacterium]
MDLSQPYFSLFELPASYAVDTQQLTARYRELQKQLHPDRFASASAQEQRLAVQYSGFVNEAYTTLRHPLRRALYLLSLAGMDAKAVAGQHIDGGFLMQQMELREKLESFHDLVDPDTVMEHLLAEIEADWRELEGQLAQHLTANEIDAAATAAVKMQYLDKLRAEAEALESELLER